MASLTTIQAVKAVLGITLSDSDALIDALIDRASATVESYCDRTLSQATHVEARDGGGGSAMMLRQYPVTSVTSVVIGGATIPQSPDGMQAGWFVSGRTLHLIGYRFTRGPASSVITYTAGFSTVPADIEAATIEVVALMLKRRDRIGVSSKSMAGESITFEQAAMPESVVSMLSSYCNMVPA